MAAKPKFSITAEDLPKVREQLAQLPSWYTDQVKGLFNERLAAYKTEMVARSTSGPIYRQTGKLAGSFYYKVEGDTLNTLSAWHASLSQTKVYTLEFGGTIFPPNGSLSWIFIPTDPNRRGDGRAIKTPKQVLDEGGRFINRFHTEFREGGKIIAPQAVINGQLSPAWNLLIDRSNVPMFIQTKRAVYQPMLGFFDAGVKHADRMTGKLADFVVEYWRFAA